VEQLERLLSRNIGNSSFLPSLDAQSGGTRSVPRERSGAGYCSRRQGKRSGAAGSYLTWRAVPDEGVAICPWG
jgi:hypothetical protein